MSFFTLFASAFLAATFLPFYSEVVLVTFLLQGESPALMWLAATLGNTLGSGVNWIMGRYLLQFQDRRWFPFKADSLEKSQRWFQKYGVWTLLFAWLPVGGDALPFIAGVMRVNPVLMLALCGIGKGIRYGVVILLTQQV